MRVSEYQMRQRSERERYLGYTQTYPYTQPYPPSFAHSTYSHSQRDMRGYATSGTERSAQPHPYGGNTARSGQPLGYSQSPDFNPIGTYMPGPFQRGVPSREYERYAPFMGDRFDTRAQYLPSSAGRGNTRYPY